MKMVKTTEMSSSETDTSAGEERKSLALSAAPRMLVHQRNMPRRKNRSNWSSSRFWRANHSNSSTQGSASDHELDHIESASAGPYQPQAKWSLIWVQLVLLDLSRSKSLTEIVFNFIQNLIQPESNPIQLKPIQNSTAIESNPIYNIIKEIYLQFYNLLFIILFYNLTYYLLYLFIYFQNLIQPESNPIQSNLNESNIQLQLNPIQAVIK